MGEPWSESWPRSGMTVDGTLYQRKTLAHRISENGGGSWPTPRANERSQGDEAVDAYAKAGFKQPTERNGSKRPSSTFDTTLTTAVQAHEIWPTPKASADHYGRPRPHDGGDLQAAALWPTPVADGDRTTNYKQGGTSLGHAARSLMLPTPQAMDSVTRSKESFHRIMDRPRQGAMLPKLADIIHVAPMLPTPSATKNTPNTVDVADLVDSDGNPWELGRKPYDRRTGQPVSTTLADVVKTKGWSIPTPTPSDNWTGNLESSQQSDDSMHSVTLPGFVARFPTSTTEVRYNTPNTMDGMAPKSQKALDHEHDTARPGRTNPNNLRDQVAVQEGLRLWPTPTGDDANNATRTSGAFQSLTPASGSSPTGQLSATWVCWLMGLPLGWDSLDPLPEGAYTEWAEHMAAGTWWAEERGLPRLAEGQKDRVNRLKMLGNGVVPASGALAFITLEGE